MRVHVTTKTLVGAVGHLERIVPSRSSNPGLSYVRISVTDDSVTLTGTNMEIDIEARLSADAAGSGTWAVPGHVLAQVVRALPGDTVELEFGDTELRITSGGFDTKLQLVDVDQAPLVSFPDEFSGSLPAQIFTRMLSSVRYAAAANDYQAVFRGIRVELHDGHSRAIASDGFRLVWYHTEETSGLDNDIIMPARAVDELTRLLDDGEVQLRIDDSQLSIGSENYRLNVKLMEGTFPDYQRVIPRTFPVEITAASADLIEAVSRVAVLSDAGANNRIDLFIEGGKLTITSEGSYGGAIESMQVHQGGTDEQLTLSYNARYLLDAVKPLSGDVRITFSGSQTPSIVHGVNETGYLAMIGPLKTGAD